MSKHHPPGPSPRSLNLPPCGVDSHAHLDMKHFGADLGAVLDRARESGVERIGNVFLSADAWRTGRELFRDRPEVFFLLAVHPNDAAAYTPAERRAAAEAFAVDPRLRAVGETGLDFYWKDCPPDVQRAAFIDQLHLARDLKRPVVIHCREAYGDTVKILRDEGFHGYPVLWHCFGGNAEQARYLVDAGWHLSIPGPVTFPANGTLRAALAVIPEDRLLTETDCPYLAPMPYRGKRNEPAYTAFTVTAMAETLGVEPAALWKRCGDNAKKFFGLE